MKYLLIRAVGTREALGIVQLPSAVKIWMVFSGVGTAHTERISQAEYESYEAIGFPMFDCAPSLTGDSATVYNPEFYNLEGSGFVRKKGT